MVDSSQKVTAETEQIQHDAAHRHERLRVRRRGVPPRLSLALAAGGPSVLSGLSRQLGSGEP